jgi:ATP-dependent DNA helicase RecG
VTTFDLTPYLTQDESQHYDRKSLFEGPPGRKRARDRRSVRDQVARYVAAFANAEGGVLVLGIEDDGTLTGHDLPPDARAALLSTPQTRLRPAQPEGFPITVQGKEVVVFDVPASDVPVQVVGDGFPLRMGDQTVEATERQIEALKFRGLAESWEARPSELGLDDLDRDLLARARAGAGYPHLSDADYLLKRRLADRRGPKLVLRRAAELLFAKHGPDHPNAGVRIFRVIGSERRLGVEHNVEERPRVEGNLASVLDETLAAVSGLVRRPSRLRGTRFQPVPEYPDFCWKEAILNAVAHRDYAIEGRTTEVWFFDDRLEVKSPGGLSPDLTLDELLRGERRHVSRNPRLVRALVELGSMRDQGEGIPRMFAEMAGHFLPDPILVTSPREFSVTLRNTPTLTASDRDFVARLGSAEVSDEEFRALLEAHRQGRVDNARMRQIAGLDTLGASQMLRRLRDRGLLALHAAGSASYYTLPPSLAPEGDERDPDRGESGSDRGESGPDRGESGSDRGESSAGLPAPVLSILARLGERPRKERLRAALAELCTLRAYTAGDLAALVHLRADKLVERHLSAMVAEGRLERTFPETPNHPEQAYRSTAATLFRRQP